MPTHPSQQPESGHTSADDSARREESRASETIHNQLAQREVELTGDESAEELAKLLAAVEEFEGAVAARGGDSFTNAPDSNDPDDRELVLPRRMSDEATPAYTARIRKAADRLRR